MPALSDVLKERAAASRRGPVKYRHREYQVTLALDAHARLARGRSVIVDLPTGAGKTNLAYICALKSVLGNRRRVCRILYVVPTRVLIRQVVRAGSWLGDTLRRVAVTPGLAANTFALRGAIGAAHVIVTTPGLFTSLLRSGRIEQATFVSSLHFVIVDEFDEFLTVDAMDTGPRARIEHAFAGLAAILGQKPLLLMSGTAPSLGIDLTHSPTAEVLSRFTQATFAPVRVAAAESSYRRFIPVAHVHFSPVNDDFVGNADRALKHRLRFAIEDFECEHGVRVNADYLLDRARGIVGGFVRSYLSAGGRKLPVTVPVRVLCRKLLATMGMYTFLFEDMFAGFDIEIRSVPLVIDCEVIKGRKKQVPLLRDSRDGNDFYPALRGKALALNRLLAEHRGERAVVFTRNTRLSDALEAMIRDAIGCPVFVLDGRLSENQRYSRITHFESTKGSVLIITRTTGKRGLDIPTADYAVMYSPKDDEYIVWQELSRIRSTLGASKPSYILLYEKTAEDNRARRLIHDMEGSVHRYKFAYMETFTSSG